MNKHKVHTYVCINVKNKQTKVYEHTYFELSQFTTIQLY